MRKSYIFKKRGIALSMAVMFTASGLPAAGFMPAVQVCAAGRVQDGVSAGRVQDGVSAGCVQGGVSAGRVQQNAKVSKIPPSCSRAGKTGTRSSPGVRAA